MDDNSRKLVSEPTPYSHSAPIATIYILFLAAETAFRWSFPETMVSRSTVYLKNVFALVFLSMCDLQILILLHLLSCSVHPFIYLFYFCRIFTLPLPC